MTTTIDYDTAFDKYNARFEKAFGDKPSGTYVKFGRFMICRLERQVFEGRLDVYVQLHAECKRMIDRGSTISDVLVIDFEEAGAWVVVQAPDVRSMFRGEVGPLREAAPTKTTREDL